MENRLKEHQPGLFADRLSAPTIAANQVRRCSASAGYLLMHAPRRLGLEGPELWSARRAPRVKDRLVRSTFGSAKLVHLRAPGKARGRCLQI
jgi:hypothetical protein